MARARQEVRKALDLDPNLAFGHVSLAGVLLYYDWDFEAAAEELRLAEEIQVDTPYLHLLKGNLLVVRGQLDGALEALGRAIDIDPSNVNLNVMRAQIHELQGDFDTAIDELEGARRIAPNYGKSNAALGVAYCETGRVDEGLELLERARAASPNDPLIAGDLGWCLAKTGRTEAAHQVIEDILSMMRETDMYVDPVSLARVHLGLGDLDSVHAYLEDAVELRALEITFGLPLDFRFRRLDGDPRFQRLVDRVGLR